MTIWLIDFGFMTTNEIEKFRKEFKSIVYQFSQIKGNEQKTKLDNGKIKNC